MESFEQGNGMICLQVLKDHTVLTIDYRREGVEACRMVTRLLK